MIHMSNFLLKIYLSFWAKWYCLVVFMSEEKPMNSILPTAIDCWHAVLCRWVKIASLACVFGLHADLRGGCIPFVNFNKY